MDYFPEIEKFFEQAKTNHLSVSHYLKTFEGLKVKVSFGQGQAARIPWIAFLKGPNLVREGYYPVYLYFRSLNKLILAYGVSEMYNSHNSWKIESPVTLLEYFDKQGYGDLVRYGNSYFFKEYDVDNLNNDEINKDLSEIITVYKAQL